jgi:zinc protease
VPLQLILWLASAAPLSAADEGAIEHRTLPCGVELFLLDDASATSVKGTITIDVGSEAEPPDRVGLVRVLSDALDRGGGEQLDQEQIEAWLAENRGDASISRDRRALSVEFFCAPEALSGCLELFRDLLAKPAYPEEQVADARGRLVAIMGSWNARPEFVANRGLYEVAYGESVTGRRILHVGDAEAISRDEVLAFHCAHVGSNRLRIALHGPLADELPDTLEDLFGDLGRVAPAPPNDWPAFRHRGGVKQVVFDVPGAEHTEIRVGFPSVALGHPDAAALHLWSWYHAQRERNRDPAQTEDEIRANVTVQFSFERMVTAQIGVETKAAADALRVLVALLSPDEDTRLDAARLESARERLLGLFQPADPGARVRSAALRHLSGRSDAAAAAHTEQLASLTAERVLEAVRRHTPASGLVAVVAGPVEELATVLAESGEVDFRSGLRQPRGSAAGVALRDRLLAAAGGSERWAALERLIYEGTATVPGLDQPSVVRVEHDLSSSKRRIEQRVPGAAPTFTVSTPEGSWSRSGQVLSPVDAARHATLRAQDERQVVVLLRELALGRGVHVDTDERGRLVIQRHGAMLARLGLGDDGLPSSLGYVDSDGSAQLTEISEWFEIDGLFLPRRLLRPGIENQWLSYEIDPVLDPAIFVVR